MNRFNLTFSGEIVEGQDPELVKLRFANKFAIDDPVRLERFFSGQTVILRRNLERKDAAQVYHELQLLGVVAALVKVPDTDQAEEVQQQPTAKKTTADATRATISRTANGTLRISKHAVAATAARETTAPTPPARWPGADGDVAAEIKARKQAAQRLAAEKAAEEQAALEAQQREIAAAAAREQALAAERQRLADEERARQAAEQARIAAEEAARQAAELAEVRRLEAEEVARKTALKVAAKRKAAEEAAERRAKRNREKAEKARRKAVEEAQRQAELAEKKRLAAEEEARRKAAAEEKKRLAAEEEARRKAEAEEKKRLAAEEEARRKAEAEEKKRLAAEEEARRKAEAEAKKRLAAEEEARRNAKAEEARRKAAAEAEEDARLQAELVAIKRREAEEAARLQAELEEKARQAAAQAARIKAEAQRLQEEAQRKSDERRRIAAEALAAQQLAARQQEALTRHAVAEASPQPLSPVRPQTLKPAKGRVKTALDVPLRKKGETPEIGVPGQRRRVSGEPNLYKLRAFRNSEAVRKRAALARTRMRRAATTAALALGVLLVTAGSYLRSADNAAITGATAIAINANSEPLLLAGDVLLLHDRAGVGTGELALAALGVSALEPPLEFAGEDVLFARGRLAGDTADSAQPDALQVLRCDLALSRCAPLTPQLQDSHIEAFVLNPVDGSVLLADRDAGQLLKVDRTGAIVARADVDIPTAPVMRLHDGLLLMNSTAGPGISVFRYEENAFAKQLDEILPLPAGELDLERARAGDFVWSGDAWWVILRTTGSGPVALHRFDNEWNYRSSVTLPADTGPLQLVNWGEKTLVNDTHDTKIKRYNALGMAEAAFASAPLQALASARQQRAGLARAAWHGGMLSCALVAVLGCALAYWHRLRNLVYRPRREQGALPLDDHAAALRWMEPVQNRQAQLRGAGIRYGLGVLAALSLAIAASVSVTQLAALLLASSGPAIALLLLHRQPTGYIGVLRDKLLLVDHNGVYHLAGGSRLQYRGPFLAIDDIVVFAGSQRLPAFSPAALQQHAWPLALGGIRVDRKTMAVKLLECRHPLALGAVAIISAAAAAALLLLLPHIF